LPSSGNNVPVQGNGPLAASTDGVGGGNGPNRGAGIQDGPNRGDNNPSFSTVITEDDAIRLEEVREQLVNAAQTLPRKPRTNLECRLQGKFSTTGKTIGFADVDVDGKFFTVGGVSGEADLPGFACLLPENQRQLSTIEVEGRNRFSDTETNILEQVLLETTEESRGVISFPVASFMIYLILFTLGGRQVAQNLTNTKVSRIKLRSKF